MDSISKAGEAVRDLTRDPRAIECEPWRGYDKRHTGETSKPTNEELVEAVKNRAAEIYWAQGKEITITREEFVACFRADLVNTYREEHSVFELKIVRQYVH